MAYVPTTASLPRSLDVIVNISRPQTEARTNLTTLCIACEDLGFLPGSERVRFYSTMAALEADFSAGSEPIFAGTNFFDQSPRANTMAIGEVFSGAQPAMLVAPAYSSSDLLNISGLTSANFSFSITEASVTTIIDVLNLNLSSVTTVESLAILINGAITSHGVSCFVKSLPGGEKRLVISPDVAGNGIMISYASADESSLGDTSVETLKLTKSTGAKTYDGYLPTGINDELTNISNAANNAGKYIYGWCLGASLRTVAIQESAAAWALARVAFMPIVSNDLNALSVSYTTDLGSVVSKTDNKRVDCIYHDNPQMYPDVSILAFMLSVDYRAKDSTVTAKFKQLPGITTVQLTETQWSVLQSKGYSSYTAIGNVSKTFRDAQTESAGWYIDTTINMDNFQEDLQLNVFNVFLRNNKIPYTQAGQMLLVDACRETGNQYTYNGSFADREIADSTQKSGISIVPAVQVIPTAISSASAADRSSRIAPPIQMIVQEAGSMESITINVAVAS